MSKYCAMDTLAFPLSSPPGPVGLLSLGAKDSNTGVGENALMHRESLVIISVGVLGHSWNVDRPADPIGQLRGNAGRTPPVLPHELSKVSSRKIVLSLTV